MRKKLAIVAVAIELTSAALFLLILLGGLR